TENHKYIDFFLHHTIEEHEHRRTVTPAIVLEVAFNNIQKSGRHASGYALRFPRIVRVRRDKAAPEIDTLETVAKLFARHTARPEEVRLRLDVGSLENLPCDGTRSNSLAPEPRIEADYVPRL